jgi:hypothetical protein
LVQSRPPLVTQGTDISPLSQHSKSKLHSVPKDTSHVDRSKRGNGPQRAKSHSVHDRTVMQHWPLASYTHDAEYDQQVQSHLAVVLKWHAPARAVNMAGTFGRRS